MCRLSGGRDGGQHADWTLIARPDAAGCSSGVTVLLGGTVLTEAPMLAREPFKFPSTQANDLLCIRSGTRTPPLPRTRDYDRGIHGIFIIVPTLPNT